MSHVSGSLRALLANLMDYAGLYPPAALALPAALDNYKKYLSSPESWILNRLVLPVSKLDAVELGDTWRVTLLVDGDPGSLPRQVETLETKQPHRLSLPTYCEAPLQKITDAFAKVRTGGLTADAIPMPGEIAEFLCEAAARRVAFKATAGLHHPIRADHRLTYSADSPHAITHGFVNVFVAAAFAWHGNDRAAVAGVLHECDPKTFDFSDDELNWRGRTLTTAQIAAARRDFAHSFGSCSFEEPVADLRALGWLK
ncbi:MAG TPA: hypothetical protein VH157_13020 [Bryobacteraceae bacterium]|nr:hypothetical protein [Bryobacteraceae bacterium]